MTLKKYQQIKLIIIVVISIIFSQSIIFQNYLIPIATLVVSSLVLILIRHQVKEVVADERDYATAGKSASLAIQIYSWIAVIAMFILYALKEINPSYEPVAMTLAFSTCALMFIYSLIFKFQNKIKFTQSKRKYIIFAVLLAILLSIFTLRLFSGEDNWICQKGERVKHGNPSFEAPKSVCK